ncbi:MAG: hypothetical protein EPN94_02635 [Nitrospirae bacterium]|nr:MAG: hypothetical protein EPN94_02635 [Nitrospirota bacterium]
MKNNIYWTLFVLICSITLSFPILSGADDLDDNIGAYTDGSIQADNTMGEPAPNIKFIKMNAKSKTKVRQKAEEKKAKESADEKTSGKSKKSDGSANMNSVVMGAGANIKGDIIIIDESKGSKTQVVDK